MHKFHAVGDYGPQGHQSIFRNFCASSPESVRLMFKGYVIRHYGEFIWDKMGDRNVEIFKGWLK